jgi:LytR cell envelope-related transcriptional attenuator
VSAKRVRNQRGVVFPSPVVMLSVLAVAMAAIAFVATRGGEPTEREVTTVARANQPSETPSASMPTSMPTKKPEPVKPVVKRGKVYVEVYNNSGITGLAGEVSTQATTVGWQVVGVDDWYGTIPTTTVYYPQRLKAAAKVLALDLGVRRTAPAVGAMKLDRLTLILTGPLA